MLELDEATLDDELDLLEEELEATLDDELDFEEELDEATLEEELDLLEDELDFEEELDATELVDEEDPPATSPVTSILSKHIPLDVVASAVILNLTVPAGREKLFEEEVQLELELNDFDTLDPPLIVMSYVAVTEEV